MATYGSVTGVKGINAYNTDGYTTSTVPTQAQVEVFLDDGYAALNARLALAGYSTPVNSTVACYAVLTRLNNLYAAACAEDAITVSFVAPGESGRGQRLWQRYDAELAALLAEDLTLLGLTKTSTAPVRRYIRSAELRRRDGYARYFDEDNTEYGSSNT